MPTITLYRFKVRSSESTKWTQTKYRLTIEEAALRYGEGNYELLEYTKELREVPDPSAPAGPGAAHLMRGLPERK